MVSTWSNDNNIKGFNGRENDHHEWFIQRHERDYDLGVESNPREEALREYARAWLGYVHEVRRLLEKHHKDEYDRMMAEREATEARFRTPSCLQN